MMKNLSFKPDSDRIGWLLLISALIGYFTFQFCGLRYAPAIFSEAGFVDYALHHRFALWERLVPDSMSQSLDPYGMGLIPGYLNVLRGVLALLGIGIVQARLVAFVAGVFQLVLFMYLLKPKISFRLIGATVVLYALCPLYVGAIHSVRSDTIIFVVSLINLTWWLQRGRSWTGFLSGGLAALALVFHPQGLLLLAVLPILAWLRGGFKEWLSRPWRFWFLGALGGAGIAFLWIDQEQVHRYASNLQGTAVHWPSLIRFAADPIQMSVSVVVLLLKAFTGLGIAAPFVLAIMVSALIVQTRHRHDLSQPKREMLWIALVYGACYVLCTASPTPQYGLVFYPWWILVTVWTLHDVSLRKMSLDPVDYVVCCFSVLMAVAFSGRLDLFWVLPLLAVMIGHGCLQARGHCLWGSLIAMGIVLLGGWDYVLGFVYWVSNTLTASPGTAALSLGLPVLWFFSVQPSSKIAMNMKGLPWIRIGAMLTLALAMGALTNQAREFLVEKRRYQNLSAALAGVPTGTAVIAPGALWLYRPDLTVAALEPVIVLRPRFLDERVQGVMRQTKFLFQPSDQAFELRGLAAQMGELKIQRKLKGSWDSPLGPIDFYELAP